MEIRNPRFNRLGTVDCEVLHQKFGWLPFTASPDDVEPHGREIYAQALAMGPAPYVAPPVVPPTQEEQEARRQEAYTRESDPLFFKWQAGEATEAEWQAKRQEIRDRYPYPTDV